MHERFQTNLHSEAKVPTLSPLPGLRPNSPPIKSAFTLSELVVVLAIVAILAALLLASLSRAKSSALASKCQGNLRQMSLGLNDFVAENKVFPLSANPELFQGRFPEHQSGWFDALSHQLSHRIFNTNGAVRAQDGVFDCPAASQPKGWPQSSAYSDYGYNAHGLGDSQANLGLGGQIWAEDWLPDLHPTTESEVRAPVDMLALGDGFVGWMSIIHDGKAWLGRAKSVTLAPDEGATRRNLKRHRGRANVAFCDGHVESVKLESLFSDTSEEALRRWNKDYLPHREKLD
jgi:prepilin-type processing-associated H-X9-DG protein/prepilin-type N-terminal cleavage/methylation domain-containing protein